MFFSDSTVLDSLVFSGGGFVVGALSVLAYAKATGQSIRWSAWRHPSRWHYRAH